MQQQLVGWVPGVRSAHAEMQMQLVMEMNELIVAEKGCDQGRSKSIISAGSEEA